MTKLQPLVEKSLLSLPPSKGLLIALSGGPDSTCLFHLLLRSAKDLNLQLLGVHLAYGLRGPESEADLAFISSLCEKEGIELLYKRVTDDERKDLLSGSLQNKARSMRHDYFAQLAKEKDMFVALGHHLDDQVETFFLHLLRGAGLPGLCGMEEFSGHLYRPLLSVSRKEILEYLEENGLTYRVDGSNEQLKYKRNRLRHQLLPVMQEIEPSVSQLVARTMHILRRENDFIVSRVKEERKENELPVPMAGRSLCRKHLLSLHTALRLRIYHELLVELSLGKEAVSAELLTEFDDMVKEGKEGRKSSLRKMLEVTYSRGRLYFIPIGQKKQYHEKLPLTDSIIDVCGFTFVTKVHENPPPRPLAPLSLFLPLEAIRGELVVRPPKVGEKCSPANFEGHKTVRALLADNKIPLPLRQYWPLIADDGGILWVAGLRRTTLVPELIHGSCLEIRMEPSADELSNR